MVIREVLEVELDKAISLVWKGFLDFEADDYSEEGVKNFKEFINNKQAIKRLKIFGAYIDDYLVGIIATRNENSHISLFFVDENYQKRGIGRRLFEKVIRSTESLAITVNSSPFAVEIYRKLGFIAMDKEQLKDGIIFVPMKYKIKCRK